jgi:hypothetical protein
MRSLLVLIWLSLMIDGCHREATGVADFIPGTYVSASRSSFGIARDTFVIRLEDGLHYRLERKVGFAAVRAGKILPGRYRREVCEAVFDPVKLELSEPVSGRIFRFDRARKVLLLNRAVYRKLPGQ